MAKLLIVEDMVSALTGIASKVKLGGKVAITSFTGDAFQPMSDIFVKNYEATDRTVPRSHAPAWKPGNYFPVIYISS